MTTGYRRRLARLERRMAPQREYPSITETVAELARMTPEELAEVERTYFALFENEAPDPELAGLSADEITRRYFALIDDDR